MGKARRDKVRSWRFQWSVVMFAAVALVAYNAVANLWLLHPASCPLHATAPPSDPPTCEPCIGGTAPSSAIDDDPISRVDLRLGRWDGSRSYRLFDYAAVGELYAEVSSNSRVCLATQSSIERLHELLRIAPHWTGPISVAVFVAGDELRQLRAFTTWLFRCQPELYSRLALHITMPAERPGLHGSMATWARDCDANPLPPGERRADTVAWRARHPYPQNHMRNLARKNCHTPFVFLVDIDIVPSRGMMDALDNFLASTPKCPLCAYVVPTYELDRRVAKFPVNKSELVRLSRSKLAIPFHRKVFIYNQYASNFSRWEASGGNESTQTHISHNVTNFELLYEPFYVAADTVPAHDERFLGYGFTRNTQHEHLRLFHAGPQLLLASIREFIWPLAGRDLARTTARQCIVCRKASGKTLTPMMGSLPEQRVNPDFPFASVGVDFAGPFLITDRKGRGCKITKCYLCIFVCLRLKCLHLEAVSELSKDAFVLALRRFIARRGKPTEIFCDNGRNFVAADKEIKDLISTHADDIAGFASGEGIKFKFQPAYAPHFGGLWEAGVKSAKFHLKRVLGNAHLTFEELATLFSQIEAILNSRPLYPLSSCPDDPQSLSPGHFLIGRPLTSLPSPNLENLNFNRLDRFQRLEQLRQSFWRRWQLEYLAELQQRQKWRVPTRSLQAGDLVLMKEENAPPMSWKLGRIQSLFPGKDGVARVAEIKTTSGIYRRGVKYLCPLLDATEDASLESGASKAPEDVRAPH